MRQLRRLPGAALLFALLAAAGVHAQGEQDTIVPETIDELQAAQREVLGSALDGLLIER